MLAKKMQNLRKELSDEGIVYCYSGYMTEKILQGIGLAIRDKLELEDADKTVIRRVFSVFIELMQNVIRYSAEKEQGELSKGLVDLRYGVLAVGERDGKFFVSCGNLITKEDSERLGEGLKRIQGLDKKQLKVLYKEILRGDVPEGSKGAGVGFVDIARRAQNGFEFDFGPEEQDGMVFFAIRAFI